MGEDRRGSAERKSFCPLGSVVRLSVDQGLEAASMSSVGDFTEFWNLPLSSTEEGASVVDVRLGGDVKAFFVFRCI